MKNIYYPWDDLDYMIEEMKMKPYDWETLGDFPPVKWKDGSTFEIVTSDGGKPHNHVSREDKTELMDVDIWREAKKVYQLSEDSTAAKLAEIDNK